jgi:membrane protease subunit HflK
VQWSIKNIKDFVFNVNRPKETIKSAAESAMREIISKTPISSVLRENKEKIAFDAMQLLQRILDTYSSGVVILNLQMLKVDPPADVINAFRDVQTAGADKERAINEAQSYHNDIIPRARGDAEQIIQDAEAYRQEVVAKATGEASRFSAILKQYQMAKDITKKRIYLETMENILTGTNKMIIDSKNVKNIQPYLPLPALNKPQGN